MEFGDDKNSQSFYPSRGRRGKKQVGGCSHPERIAARYVRYSLKKWIKIFKDSEGRNPSELEVKWAVQTGQLARDVIAVERERKRPGILIHRKMERTMTGKSPADALAAHIAEQRKEVDRMAEEFRNSCTIEQVERDGIFPLNFIPMLVDSTLPIEVAAKATNLSIEKVERIKKAYKIL